MERIWIYDNPISDLDLKNNIKLWLFSGYKCHFNSLDFSKNKNLAGLWLNDNPKLESLNLNNKNNSKIEALNITNTPLLSCIQVDDTNYSTRNWLERDKHHSFNKHCFKTLKIKKLTTNNFHISPNPAKNKIVISIETEIKYVEIYSLLGKKVLKSKDQNEIDISQLPNAVYFIKVHTNTGIGTKKFIKN